MRHSEYEKRRRALEKQYEEDRELLRAAHEARLRSLETLWLASPPTEAAAATEPVPAVEEDPRPEEAEGEKSASNETQTPNEPQTLNETQKEVRLPRGGLRDAVEDALPLLPEVFDRQDLERVLGFTPRRSSLVRILKDLWWEKKTLEIVEFSEGRRPTKYRKVAGPG